MRYLTIILLASAIALAQAMVDVSKLVDFRRLVGHKESVLALSALAGNNGIGLLSASVDGTIRVWNTSTGKEQRQLKLAPDTYPLALDSSGDGKTAIAGLSDNSAIIFDTTTFKTRVLTGHTNEIKTVDLSADAKLALTGSRDNTAILWDATTAQIRQRFIGHTEIINAVAISPDQQSVYTASDDATVRRWNARTGIVQRTYIFAIGVRSIALSRDGKRLLAGANDGVITALETETGNEIRRYIGHRSDVTSVQYSPDGATILSSSSDGTARLWNTSTGGELRQFSGLGGIAYDASYNPNGKQFFIASSNSTIRIWATSGMDNFFNGPAKPVTNTAVVRPSAVLASTKQNSTSLEFVLRVVNPTNSKLSFDVFIGNTALEVLGVTRDIGVAASTPATTPSGLINVKTKLPDNLANGDLPLKIIVSNLEATAEPIISSLKFTSANSKQRLFVLAVGINKYDDAKIRDLGSATNDATDIAAFFSAQQGKTFDEVQTTLLTDRQADYAIVKKKIGEFRKLGRNDTAIIFFAGHGFNQQGDYFIPMSNSDYSNFEATAIAQRDLVDFVSRTQARSIVLVDTCHAGAILGFNASDNPSSMDALVSALTSSAVPLGAGSNDRVIFAASRGSQYAQELSGLRNGVFTHALLEGLRGKAANNSGEIRISALINYVSQEVPRLAGNQQTPQQFVVGSNFVVAKK